MRRSRPKTHEQMLSNLIDDFQQLIDEIQVNQKSLEINDRTSDEAKYHRTRKIIRNWMREHGDQY